MKLWTVLHIEQREAEETVAGLTEVVLMLLLARDPEHAVHLNPGSLWYTGGIRPGHRRVHKCTILLASSHSTLFPHFSHIPVLQSVALSRHNCYEDSVVITMPNCGITCNAWNICANAILLIPEMVASAISPTSWYCRVHSGQPEDSPVAWPHSAWTNHSLSWFTGIKLLLHSHSVHNDKSYILFIFCGPLY